MAQYYLPLLCITYDHCQDLQAGPTHHRPPDTGHDSQKQVSTYAACGLDSTSISGVMISIFSFELYRTTYNGNVIIVKMFHDIMTEIK